MHPYRDGNSSLAERYFQVLLNARHVRMVALSPAIAAEAARIRAEFQMKTPDAIQLATAKEGGATSFLTNDGELASIFGLRLIFWSRFDSGSEFSGPSGLPRVSEKLDHFAVIHCRRPRG